MVGFLANSFTRTTPASIRLETSLSRSGFRPAELPNCAKCLSCVPHGYTFGPAGPALGSKNLVHPLRQIPRGFDVGGLAGGLLGDPPTAVARAVQGAHHCWPVRF